MNAFEKAKEGLAAFTTFLTEAMVWKEEAEELRRRQHVSDKQVQDLMEANEQQGKQIKDLDAKLSKDKKMGCGPYFDQWDRHYNWGHTISLLPRASLKISSKCPAVSTFSIEVENISDVLAKSVLGSQIFWKCDPNLQEINDNPDTPKLLQYGMCGNSLLDHKENKSVEKYLFRALIMVAFLLWGYMQPSQKEIEYSSMITMCKVALENCEAEDGERALITNMFRYTRDLVQNQSAFNDTLPPYAHNHTLRFLRALTPLFTSKTENGEDIPIISADGTIAPALTEWASKLEAFFLQCMKVGYQMRQKKEHDIPRIVWPTQEAVWDKDRIGGWKKKSDGTIVLQHVGQKLVTFVPAFVNSSGKELARARIEPDRRSPDEINSAITKIDPDATSTDSFTKNTTIDGTSNTEGAASTSLTVPTSPAAESAPMTQGFLSYANGGGVFGAAAAGPRGFPSYPNGGLFGAATGKNKERATASTQYPEPLKTITQEKVPVPATETEENTTIFAESSKAIKTQDTTTTPVDLSSASNAPDIQAQPLSSKLKRKSFSEDAEEENEAHPRKKQRSNPSSPTLFANLPSAGVSTVAAAGSTKHTSPTTPFVFNGAATHIPGADTIATIAAGSTGSATPTTNTHIDNSTIEGPSSTLKEDETELTHVMVEHAEEASDEIETSSPIMHSSPLHGPSPAGDETIGASSPLSPHPISQKDSASAGPILQPNDMARSPKRSSSQMMDGDDENEEPSTKKQKTAHLDPLPTSNAIFPSNSPNDTLTTPANNAVSTTTTEAISSTREETSRKKRKSPSRGMDDSVELASKGLMTESHKSPSTADYNTAYTGRSLTPVRGLASPTHTRAVFSTNDDDLEILNRTPSNDSPTGPDNTPVASPTTIPRDLTTLAQSAGSQNDDPNMATTPAGTSPNTPLAKLHSSVLQNDAEELLNENMNNGENYATEDPVDTSIDPSYPGNEMREVHSPTPSLASSPQSSASALAAVQPIGSSDMAIPKSSRPSKTFDHSEGEKDDNGENDASPSNNHKKAHPDPTASPSHPGDEMDLDEMDSPGASPAANPQPSVPALAAVQPSGVSAAAAPAANGSRKVKPKKTKGPKLPPFIITDSNGKRISRAKATQLQGQASLDKYIQDNGSRPASNNSSTFSRTPI